MAKGKSLQNGRKGQKNPEDDYVKISKKHINLSLFFGLVAFVYYHRESIKNFLPKNQVEQSINVVKERVDLSQKTANYIIPYVEAEVHPNPQVRNLPKDLSHWPPGEMGIGLTLDERKMSSEQSQQREEMYKKHAFQEYVSSLISLERSLPDFRGQWCRDQYDGDNDHLEKVSVIICFHNEAWSTLLRSVHSIVNRTPRKLLEEILLVDDKSDQDHLGQPLDDYVAAHFPNGLVKVVRQEERQGLMRSRMAGIRASQANILVFLDSHIEAGIGWLEPMLQGIHDNPRLITSPVIDAINDTTFFYRFIEKDIFGLMNWRMEFEWHELDLKDRSDKPNIWAPHENPIMAGGLFAIRKDYFEELGFYDEGMEIWGGENYELSFKAWMCGGRIEIAPCSRVGHVFRTWSPYKIGDAEINHNLVRVAEVWMDDFKYLFYSRLGRFDEPVAQRLGDFDKNLSERKSIRSQLKCKSFAWFLDNIVAGRLPYHELIGAGELRNPRTDLCLDKNDRTEHMDELLDLIPCHNRGGFQYWWYNRNRFLLRDYMCIGVNAQKLATVTHCQRASQWVYDPQSKTIKDLRSGLCMSVFDLSGQYRVKMVKCNPSDEFQQFTYTFYKKSGLKYSEIV